MIVGTAGHIDHGKTSLVRALTGVDTDRLKEEKARGISIDLGFAYLPAPDGAVLGFVDVPGHEKFVHNMLAGATGIDFVLLVIAADDGIMPQTREHLAIVDLLGITRGVVALTKIDLVAPQQQAKVLADIAQLLRGTGLDGAEIVAISTVTNEGVDQDFPRALELYRAAAEQDDGAAQDMLSWMLLEGEIAAPDYVAARRFAEAAAAHGVAASMTRLGMIFHNALGVERDPGQAVDWWRRGAERGDADGQAMLGAAFHLGSGVERDPVEAFVWLLRARAAGSPLAGQFFQAVHAALTPAQIAEAERRAGAPLPEAAS